MHKVTTYLCASLVFLLFACDNQSAQKNISDNKAAVLKGALPVPVEVVEVRRGDLYRPIVATGAVNPWLEAHVGGKIAGRIQSIPVKEGEWVAKGKILFQLEQTDFLLNRQGAQAQLSLARASLQEAKINLENIAREKERFNRLFEKNAISQQKNDDINSAYLMAKNKIDLALANLAAAEVNLALAEARLDDATVRAPFAGLIFRKMANEAEMISAGAPVVSLMNIDRVKLDGEIPEQHAPEVEKGAAVEVTVDALPGKVFRGEISLINSRVNPQSRTFRVEIHIENTGHLIKPGMFSRIVIKTGTRGKVLILPAKALVGDPAGGYFVLVAKDNRAARRKIVPGLTGDILAEIKEGLEVGEKVVVTGNYGMEEGTALSQQVVLY